MAHSVFKARAVCLGITSLIVGVQAQDWPQWRGPWRTGHAADTRPAPQKIAPQPTTLWRLDIGAGLASPVVAKETVFYFDNQEKKETLHAVNAANGREIWRAAIDDVFADEQGPSGPRCTPLVDEDRVYAQSGKGELRCLRTTDGGCVWRVNFTNDFGAGFYGEDTPVPGAAEHGYTASPLVVGQKLIACAGGTNGAGVVCFEKRTGQLLWKSQNDRAAYAAPVVANWGGVEQAVCFTVEGLIGLAVRDGALLWRVPIKTPYGRNCTTPVVVGDIVVVGSYRAGLIGVKVSREGEVFRAERAWVNKELAMNFSSPVALGTNLFGLGPAKQLVCVDATTGQAWWSQKGYLKTSAEVAYASFLVLGSNVLLTTDTGEMAMFAGEGSGFRELGQAKVCGANWCNPAYAAGKLYIRDGLKSSGTLYCIELGP